jgi:transposase
MVLTRQESRLSEKNRQNASNPHHSTPKKARIRAAHEQLQAHESTGYHDTNIALFRRYDVAKSSGYRILASESANQSDRTFHNQPGVTETRGRRKKIIDEDLHQIEEILHNSDIETRSVTWETLAYEAGLDVSVDTIRRAIGSLDYHKCIACRKAWINKDLGKRRKEWASTMIDRYPDLED